MTLEGLMQCRQCGYDIIKISQRLEDLAAYTRGFCSAKCQELFDYETFKSMIIKVEGRSS